RYDAVVALECLAEIPDDEAALRHLVAALRPGGLLLVHVPERSWRPVLPGGPKVWTREVRHGYSASELGRALESAGLAAVSIRPTMGAPLQLAEELRARMKGTRLRRRLLAAPLMGGAVALERRGVSWGARRALFAQARK